MALTLNGTANQVEEGSLGGSGRREGWREYVRESKGGRRGGWRQGKRFKNGSGRKGEKDGGWAEGKRREGRCEGKYAA